MLEAVALESGKSSSLRNGAGGDPSPRPGAARYPLGYNPAAAAFSHSPLTTMINDYDLHASAAEADLLEIDTRR